MRLMEEGSPVVILVKVAPPLLERHTAEVVAAYSTLGLAADIAKYRK